ncbi:MAG: alkaline phosphatase family protein [Defluviitaleaceae bacterium]|nr:alkaline phosphatase family protein [Defluviitaleaceae bacterium]
MSILVISFDGVGDKAFEEMVRSGRYPNIATFSERATYIGDVESVFVSDTIPVHTTVSTGKPPKDHGIVSNHFPKTRRGELPWVQLSNLIQEKTLWDAANEKGLKTAAIPWPVTCGAKIRYNVPDFQPLKGQNKTLRQLMYGSKFFQLKSMIKHRSRLKNMEGAGNPQIQRDNFMASVATDVLKKKNPPALTLVQLVAYNHAYRYEGADGEGLEIAKESLDENFGKLIRAWRGTTVVFSGHSQLDVHESVNLNVLYKDNFLQRGGCAFGMSIPLDMPDQYWFGRYLTKDEIEESGYAGKYTFGVAPKPGFNFTDRTEVFRGDCGYPTNYPGYSTFYAINKELDYAHKLYSSVRDVTAIIAKELGLDMDILEEYGL